MTRPHGLFEIFASFRRSDARIGALQRHLPMFRKTGEVQTAEFPHGFLQVAQQSQGLVHFPAAVVGPQNSCFLLHPGGQQHCIQKILCRLSH